MNPLKIHKEGHRQHIYFSWRQPKAYFLIFFCLFWDGFMIVWYSTALTQGAWIMAAFGIIHLAVGIGLTYYTLCLLFNSTNIWISKEEVKIEHGPIPAINSGLTRIDSRDLKQLYVKEKIIKGKNGPSHSYSLRGKFQDGSDQVVISKHILRDAEMALQLEEEIEGFLGITDYHVKEEYKDQNYMGEIGESKRPRNLSRPINPTDLTLQDLKKGYFLNFQGESWEVAYETQYDWKGEESDRQLQLTGDNDQNLLLYLQSDLAHIIPWTETRLETHEMMGEEFEVKKLDGEIVQIQFQDQLFKLSSTHQGQMFLGERLEESREVQQWFYLSPNRKEHLRIVRIGESKRVAYIGQQQPITAFTHILPNR